MKKHFQKETNPDILREILSHCESEIENLASEGRVARTYFHYKNHKKIKILTELRADILDRMFELHFNKTDFERLSKVNSMLETYENNLIAKHIDMYKILKEMDNNYKLDNYLLYRHLDENYSLHPLKMIVIMVLIGTRCLILLKKSLNMITNCLSVAMKGIRFIMMAGANLLRLHFQ